MNIITLVMTFSVAKPFAALAFLDAVGDGAVGLDQPVASVWPAFGCLGKDVATIAAFSPTRRVSRRSRRRPSTSGTTTARLLWTSWGSTDPIHRPGDGLAEHALTSGHLLDEVLRRATGEPLVERFARLVDQAGWDLHLRVEEHDLTRIARLVEPGGTWRSGYLDDPRWGPALGRPPGLLNVDVLNSEAFCGSARSPPSPCTPVPCRWRRSTTR